MIVTAILLLAVAGLGLITRELRRAPEGYEDENGFHVIQKPVIDSGATKLRQRHLRHPQTQPATAH
jgi:hypothetical protein